MKRERRFGQRGKQYYVYCFPLLKECREVFDASMRYTRDWGELTEWQKSDQDDPQSGAI